MKKPSLLNQKGFTLIEIISVLVILGILAVVAVPKYIDLQDEARVRAASGAIAEVQARLSMSYGKHLLVEGTEPASISALVTWANTEEDPDPFPPNATTAFDNIGDFTVFLTYTAPDNISVTEVDGVALGTAATGTWDLP